MGSRLKNPLDNSLFQDDSLPEPPVSIFNFSKNIEGSTQSTSTFNHKDIDDSMDLKNKNYKDTSNQHYSSTNSTFERQESDRNLDSLEILTEADVARRKLNQSGNDSIE